MPFVEFPEENSGVMETQIGFVAAFGTGVACIGRCAAAGQTTCLVVCLQLDISFP